MTVLEAYLQLAEQHNWLMGVDKSNAELLVRRAIFLANEGKAEIANEHA